MRKRFFMLLVIVLLVSIQGSVFAQTEGLELVDEKLELVLTGTPTVFLVFENTGTLPMRIGYEWDDVEDPSVVLLDADGNELEVKTQIYTMPDSILPGERGYAAVEFWNVEDDAVPTDYTVTFNAVEDPFAPVERVYMDATPAIEDFADSYSTARGLVVTITNNTEYTNFLDDSFIALVDKDGKLILFSSYYAVYDVSIAPGSTIKTLEREFFNDDDKLLADVDFEKSIAKVWFDIFD